MGTVNIYDPSQEVNYNDTSADTDALDNIPGLQQLQQQQQQQQEELAQERNEYLTALKEYDNPYTAVIESAKARQVHDPRVTRARQSLASLYDALQIIGTAAAMGKNRGTPTPPQLTSAAASQNAYANRMRELQLSEDKEHANRLQQLRTLSNQFEQKREKDIAEARHQYDKEKRTLNRLYTTESRKMIDNYYNRKNRLSITADNNRRAIEVANIRNKRKTDYTLLDYDGVDWKLPKSQEASFKSEMQEIIHTYGLGDDLKGRTLNDYLAYLRMALNRNIDDVGFVDEASKLLEKYFTTTTPKTTSKTTPKKPKLEF